MISGNPPSCENYACFDQSVFRFLSPEEREKLCREKRDLHFKKGRVIFHEGETPTGIFCLQSGKVKIYKMSPEGQQQIVRLARPGNLIGYRALIAGDEYNATAETLEESHVCFFSRGVFSKALDSSPTLIRHFLEHLAHDLRFSEDRFLSFVQKQARERVAETLVLLMEAYGKSHGKGETIIDVSLSRKEIAELSGIVLETAVRLLSEFKKEKLVAFQGKKIIVFDKFKLLKISNTSVHLVSWK